MPKTNTPPKYRLHRPSGRAVVSINGNTVYLGKHGSRASRAKYGRLIAEWSANDRQFLPRADEGLTIRELLAAFWRHAQAHYQKDGEPTPELGNFKTAMRVLKQMYADTQATAFGPLALKAVRSKFIGLGWSRTHVNQQTGRVKRILKWAVQHELIPPSVYHGLQAVDGLRRGRSDAREGRRIMPVPDEFVDAIDSFVSRPVWAIIDLQRLTGMRPGEVAIMRARDLDMAGKLWLYRPESHKTQHHGYERVIELGRKAQAVIRQFLRRDLDAYLFSPADAEAERRDTLHKKRRTPLSCGNRPGTNRRRRPQKTPGDHYDVAAYRRAIYYACERAFPPPKPLARRKGETIAERRVRLTTKQAEQLKAWCREHRWHPHQLRHSFATRVRKEFGLEAARVLLGHRSAVTSELYAEIDRAKVASIVLKIG